MNQQGSIKLEDRPDGELEILVFGGSGADDSRKDATFLFRANAYDTSNSSVKRLKSANLIRRDTFYHNIYTQLRPTHLSKSSLKFESMDRRALVDPKLKQGDLLGILGLENFHIFDKTRRCWIGCAFNWQKGFFF